LSHAHVSRLTIQQSLGKFKGLHNASLLPQEQSEREQWLSRCGMSLYRRSKHSLSILLASVHVEAHRVPILRFQQLRSEPRVSF
jgi:uncharacterized paraquat-inducible protein A